MSKSQYDMRRVKGMELFTRSYQWCIVNELLGRNGNNALAQILQLTEFIEADSYAHNLSMSYNVGEVVKSFSASDYASERELCSHIYSLTRKEGYILREELIQTADYIQTAIVEKGETASHLELVNAIPSIGKSIQYSEKEVNLKRLSLSGCFHQSNTIQKFPIGFYHRHRTSATA